MAYEYDDTGDLVINGFDSGIASSPHNGIANLQSVNIATEVGEVMCSYQRVQQSQINSTATGTISPNATDSLLFTFSSTLTSGVWITIAGSTITGLSNTSYFVNSVSSNVIQLQTEYQSALLSGLGNSGSATFTLTVNMGNPIASATEKYSDGTTFQYRYFILDSNGRTWVQDSAVSLTGGSWFIPDTVAHTNATGIAVLNGWLMDFVGNTINCKPTSILQNGSPGWVPFYPGFMTSLSMSPNPHTAFVGHQGKLYYTDGNFLGSIFPNSALITTVSVNIQSYASYTASTSTGTISVLINGSIPTLVTSTARIPAFFFTHGTKPNAITVGTIYYIAYSNSGATFQVFTAASGGSALDIQTGSSGTQYFNTFYPTSSDGSTTITFTPEKLNLPFFETAQSIAELDNTIIVGCKGNTLYNWNQVDPTPADIILLPERDAVRMLTVNNMVYILAGTKGNIYISSGSSSAIALSVPDYCAGIPGTQASYIEPYFSWGGCMYLRGRVYFSILDQTSTKAGNCGGVWSFTPTQNMYIGQDQGTALRLENRASYGTYGGVSTVLLASENQSAKSPQYWNGWESSISSPTYGIDFTDTKPGTPAVIETDLIPTGTILRKKTFKQIEYKLSAPLVSGESVAISYRQNATDAYTALTNLETESVTGLSGVYKVNFEKGQWLQFQITLTPVASTSSSFVRLLEIRIR